MTGEEVANRRVPIAERADLGRELTDGGEHALGVTTRDLVFRL
jgi:hypothetical protein